MVTTTKNIDKRIKITDSWICLSCKHFVGLTRNDKPVCIAFLKGIPDEILNGKNDHSKPLEGQEDDTVYEAVEED